MAFVCHNGWGPLALSFFLSFYCPPLPLQYNLIMCSKGHLFGLNLYYGLEMPKAYSSKLYVNPEISLASLGSHFSF